MFWRNSLWNKNAILKSLILVHNSWLGLLLPSRTYLAIDFEHSFASRDNFMATPSDWCFNLGLTFLTYLANERTFCVLHLYIQTRGFGWMNLFFGRSRGGYEVNISKKKHWMSAKCRFRPEIDRWQLAGWGVRAFQTGIEFEEGPV